MEIGEFTTTQHKTDNFAMTMKTSHTKLSNYGEANEGQVGNPISPPYDVDAEKAAAALLINQLHQANNSDTFSANDEEETILTNPPTDQGRHAARLARDLRDDHNNNQDVAQATQNSLRDAAGAFRVNGSGVVTPASPSALAAECRAEPDECHPTNFAATASEGSAQMSTGANYNLPPNIDIIAEATLVKSERSGEHDEENPQQQRELEVVNAERMDKFSIYVCGRHTRLWHLILLTAIVVAICVAVPVAVTTTREQSTEQPSKPVGRFDPDQGEQEVGRTVLIWPREVLYDLVVPSISHPSAFNETKTMDPSPQQQALHLLTKTFVATWPEGEPLPNEGSIKFQGKIRQLYILAVLYYSTNGENWKNQYGFLTSKKHVCDWHVSDEGKGIECNEEEEITLLNLSQNNLQGPIPRELGSLQFSGGLHLEGNNLTGTVPQELAQLTQVTQIYLNDNDLKGSIEFMCDTLKVTEAPVDGMYANETGALSELYVDRDEVECSCCSCCPHVEEDGEGKFEETGDDGRV